VNGNKAIRVRAEILEFDSRRYIYSSQSASNSMAKLWPFPMLPMLGVKETVHILLVLRVWMCGAKTPLLKMLSGRKKEKFTIYNSIYYCRSKPVALIKYINAQLWWLPSHHY